MNSAVSELEAAFSDEERRDDVAKVADLIQRLGIKYIYVLYPSLTGRMVGKGVPARHWENVARQGVQLVFGSVANVTVDRHGQYIGYGPEATELLALPQPKTFVQLPWDKEIARVFASLYLPSSDPVAPGAAFSCDCRTNLKVLHDRFRERHNVELRIGTEPEMMWLKSDAEGTLTGVSKPYCYHIEQFEELRPVMKRVIQYGEALGLDFIQGDHEDAPGQLELNFSFDDPLRNADRLLTYRQVCGQVGRELGYRPVFMAKPFQGFPGNGCHHNISLWSPGEDCLFENNDVNRLGMDDVYSYKRRGTNQFVSEQSIDGLSDLGRWSVAGIIEHMSALTAIAASTVNSYRRLLDTGYWAPATASWGYQNRTCAIRVPSASRIEYRGVDAMVNPYLMAAGLIQAIDDGITRRLDPGVPQESSAYTTHASIVASRLSLPTDLGKAIDALSCDEVIRSAMPGDILRVYMEIKSAEWQRFLASVTDWDRATYLDYIP